MDVTDSHGRDWLYGVDAARPDQIGRSVRRMRTEGRWAFFVTMAPWRFEGATGSAVNPLAIF
jgi:hypothetical protein